MIDEEKCDTLIELVNTYQKVIYLCHNQKNASDSCKDFMEFCNDYGPKLTSSLARCSVTFEDAGNWVRFYSINSNPIQAFIGHRPPPSVILDDSCENLSLNSTMDKIVKFWLECAEREHYIHDGALSRYKETLTFMRGSYVS